MLSADCRYGRLVARRVWATRRGFAAAGLAWLLLLGLFTATAAASGTSLLLPQSTAFSVLGRSCGGIQEQAFATGFAVTGGSPSGDVYLQTRCGGSGRGGGYHTTTYSAWTSATWDFSCNLLASAKLASAPSGLNPAFSATDAHGDQLSNVVRAVNVTPANCTVGNTTYCTYRAYLTVPTPAAPTGVRAVQVGDQFHVNWTADPATAAVISASTITATPVGSTAPAVSMTLSGSGTGGLVGPLQPLTSYQITVTSTDAGGSSPASSPVTASTVAASVPPSAPPNVSAYWTAPGQPGDTLGAAWTAPAPGDSPIDQYQVNAGVAGGEGSGPGPLTTTTSGSVFSATFAANDVYDWYIQARAHNAAGWGPWSAQIVLSSSA